MKFEICFHIPQFIDIFSEGGGQAMQTQIPTSPKGSLRDNSSISLITGMSTDPP